MSSGINFKRKVKSRKMLINLYIYLVPVMYVAVRESLRCDQFIEGSGNPTTEKGEVHFCVYKSLIHLFGFGIPTLFYLYGLPAKFKFIKELENAFIFNRN